MPVSFDVSATATLKPVGVASRSVPRADDAHTAAFHHHHHHHQPQQHDALCEIKDATLDSEASCIALRSNCGLLSSNEAQSPSLQQKQSVPLVAELQTLQHQQAVEHCDAKHDSGIYELATMLNR